MKRYVTCHVIDTAPLSTANTHQPAAICKPARIYRPPSNDLRTRQPRTQQQSLSASAFQSLASRIYSHHPFPPGELVNIAV